MALTTAQKAKVRFYLGYEKLRELYPYLETKFGVLDDDENTLVASILTKLDALDTAISASISGGDDGLKSVGNDKVVWQDLTNGTTLADLQAQRGRFLVSQLEGMMGVSRKFDVFSPGGSRGRSGAIALG